jgi:hypothetical protein
MRASKSVAPEGYQSAKGRRQESLKPSAEIPLTTNESPQDMNNFSLPARLAIIVAALASLILAANAFAAETDFKLDPCALITKEEVAKIIGELKETPKPDTGLQKEKECHYSTTTGAWLKVSLYSATRWGMQKGIVSEMNPTDLPGLGEGAFAVKRGTTYEIYVRKGELILEVSSTVGANPTLKFAQQAATQLPLRNNSFADQTIIIL